MRRGNRASLHVLPRSASSPTKHLESTLNTLRQGIFSQWASQRPALPTALTSAIQEAPTIAGHNLPVDLDQLLKLGLAKPGWLRGIGTRDSLLLARLVDENRGKGAYKLQPLLLAYENARPWKDVTEALGPDATTWPRQERIERCRTDAWAAAVLVDRLHQDPQLPPPAVVDFVHAVAMTLHRIYLAGAVVDLSVFREITDSLQTTAERARSTLTTAAFKLGMREFSPTNDGNLRELLYGKLGLPVLRRTEKTRAPKVDNDTIRQFAADEPLVKTLLEFNSAHKLYSTWYGSESRQAKAVPLRDMIRPFGPDRGWIGFSIFPFGARTGRRASGTATETDGVIASPNSQNWPKAMRRIIVSRFPDGKVGNFDYAKLEIVLFAYISSERKLYDYFSGGGGYIDIAEEFFKISGVRKDTKEYTLVKSTTLAVQYGAGDWQLAEQLWYKLGVQLSKTWKQHLEKVHDLRVRYLDMFPGIRTYMAARKRELLEMGQVRLLSGRVRHLPHTWADEPPPGDPDYRAWKHLLNEAINAPVQGLAADITGAAEVDAEAALCVAHGLTVEDYHAILLWEYERVLRGVAFEPASIPRLINEVHDSLVADLPARSADQDAEIIGQAMTCIPTFRRICPDFTLRLKHEATIGPAWGGGE